VIEILTKVVDTVETKVERWTKPVTIGAGVVSLLWGLLLLPVEKRSFYLVTWVADDKAVYPSEATSDTDLPLYYSGVRVHSARILLVRIQNRGSTPIGSPEKLWTLDVRAPRASHLVLLDPPKATPTPSVVQRRDTSDPQLVQLDFGVMDPRVSVELRMMLVNATGSGPPLAAQSTLTGLPEEVTFASLSSQLADRYLWQWASPVFLLFCVPVLPPLFREWSARTPAWKRVLWVPLYVAVALLGTAVPALLWVVFLSKVVAWLY